MAAFAFPGDHVVTAGLRAAPPASPANPQHVTNFDQDLAMSVCQVHSSAIAPAMIDCPWKPMPAKAGRGSGFVVEHCGQHLIVTNHHVIADARRVAVAFPRTGTGTKYEARVKIDCPTKDIAVLELVNPSVALKPLKLANCDTVPVASPVYAVGFPLGQEHCKVTSGVFAGRERMQNGSFLQISAPLCPGNSGGCLLHDGAVVGINSAIIPGQNCVGYSIPITQLESVLHDYKCVPAAEKSVDAPCYLAKPILGAIWQNSDAALSAYVQNDAAQRGVYVTYCMPGSLLHKGGLRRGMVVNSVAVGDGAMLPVSYSGEVSGVEWSQTPVHISDMLERLQVGDRVRMAAHSAARGPQEIEFTYHRTNDPRAVKQVFAPYDKVNYVFLGGMVCADLTVNHVQAFMQQNPTLATYLDPSNLYKPAVIVSHVSPYGAMAASRRAAPGMMLTALNGDRVRSVADIKAWCAENAGKVERVDFTLQGFCKCDVAVPVATMYKEYCDATKLYRYPSSEVAQMFAPACAGAVEAAVQEVAETRVAALIGADVAAPVGVACCGKEEKEEKKTAEVSPPKLSRATRAATFNDDPAFAHEMMQSMGWMHMSKEDACEAFLSLTD